MARVVVVGAGIAGLAAGLLLGPDGHDVTILEQDAAEVPPDRDEAWSRWARPGVAQFQAIHLFNARGRNLLRDRLPAVLDGLRRAGAGEIRLLGPEDDEVVRLTCRRTTYEMVLRRAAEEAAGVRILPGVTVTGLMAASRDGHVTVGGVHTSAGLFTADVVVDASGRRSRLGPWLEAIGARPPEVEGTVPLTVGYTRWYRLRRPEPVPLARADLGYAACVLAPADEGWFCVTLGCLAWDTALRALRTEAAFDAAVGAVEALRPWVDPDRVAVEPGVRVMGDTPNRFSRSLVPGVVALGDATMCTNPGYGRGVGLALVHVAGLADLLRAGGDEPLRLAAALDGLTRAELEPWYHAAVRSDRVRGKVGRRVLAGEAAGAIGGPEDDPEVRFARFLPHATAQDPVVRRAYHRWFQLLDPPAVLDGEDVRARVEAVARDLDGAAPPLAGPDHETMARLVEAAYSAR